MDGEGGGTLISGNIHYEAIKFGTDILPTMYFLKTKKSLTQPFSKMLMSALFLMPSSKIIVKWVYFCFFCRISLNNCGETIDPIEDIET